MPLEFQIDYDRGVPVYRQIFDAITAALASGALARDEQLPTIHELASRLAINPNTVARAYRELDQAGFITSQRGVGTFPSADRTPVKQDKDRVLRTIYDKAVSEAAHHGISPAELVRYFQKVKP
ncbi:MAG TPA: GntR family transcriptional regulator [Kofleriaceae bacterium]|nr:GntR family transcriptional regulator [Kofleriaceae bacterium]